MEKLLHEGYSNSLDLVYIDPPFATNQVFTISEGRSATISRENGGTLAYSDKFTLDAYLDFLTPRLEAIHKLLSKKGSLYLHIDYKIGHYVKVLLDKIFGINQFRADITRIKCNPKNFQRRNYGNIKDMILFYSKTENFIWNDVGNSQTECSIKKRFTKQDENGRLYTTVPLHAPGETSNGGTGKEFMGKLPPKGRHWRYSRDKLENLYKMGQIEISKTGNMRLKNYADLEKDVKKQDIWEFKDPQYPKYPTEKNEDMLDYIILNSSDKNSYVMDCFSGCGTTLISAHKFDRKYIGIDISPAAIRITKDRLKQ